MKKTGFTLIELLSVIVIIGIILIIAVPILGKILDEQKQESYNFQIKSIEMAAKNWSIDNLMTIVDDGEEITITLSQLKSGGYIGKELKNPLDGKNFPNDMSIIIKRLGASSQITVLKDSGTDFGSFTNSVVTYVMNGRIIENVQINSPYVDKGITFYDSTNQVLAHTTTIYSGTLVIPSVTTSVKGNYRYEYKTGSGANEVKITRNVVVEDTLPPVINIPGSIYITIAAINTLDLNTGVSVTDNSGEALTFAVSGVVNPVVGKYQVKYTSTDSSGNKTEKIRIVNVKP